MLNTHQRYSNRYVMKKKTVMKRKLRENPGVCTSKQSGCQIHGEQVWVASIRLFAAVELTKRLRLFQNF